MFDDGDEDGFSGRRENARDSRLKWSSYEHEVRDQDELPERKRTFRLTCLPVRGRLIVRERPFERSGWMQKRCKRLEGQPPRHCLRAVGRGRQ